MIYSNTIMTGIYIDDRFTKDGMVDTGAMRLKTIFDIKRPSVEEAMARLNQLKLDK